VLGVPKGLTYLLLVRLGMARDLASEPHPRHRLGFVFAPEDVATSESRAAAITRARNAPASKPAAKRLGAARMA
jgi:hypothetical protein